MLQRYLKDTFSSSRFGGYETKNMSEILNLITIIKNSLGDTQMSWIIQILFVRWCLHCDFICHHSVALLSCNSGLFYYNIPLLFVLFTQNIDHATRDMALLDSLKITNQVLLLKNLSLEDRTREYTCTLYYLLLRNMMDKLFVFVTC